MPDWFTDRFAPLTLAEAEAILASPTASPETKVNAIDRLPQADRDVIVDRINRDILEANGRSTPGRIK